jgi:hypothetical protein
MLTPPADLAETVLYEALRAGWGLTAVSLQYQALGFGSHHWLAADGGGRQLFATVDDLPAKLHGDAAGGGDLADLAFARLASAFGAARELAEDAGLEFVVAPVRDRRGAVLRRLQERYSLVVHPVIAGRHVGEDGEFQADADRRAVLEMLVRLHRSNAPSVLADDFALPGRNRLAALLRDAALLRGAAGQWGEGPYARPARSLLFSCEGEVRALLRAYDTLAAGVASRPWRLVVTHGEPHAGNVMRIGPGAHGPDLGASSPEVAPMVLIDWDSVLLAPPERDLWSLSLDRPWLLEQYTTATGVAIDPEALTFYRLYYDLAEIGCYLMLFAAPHADTADTAQSWRNLRHFLRPAARWPELIPAASGLLA